MWRWHKAWREREAQGIRLPELQRGQHGLSTQPCGQRDVSVTEGDLEHMWKSHSLCHSFSHSAKQFTELPVCTLPKDGYLGSAYLIMYHRLLEPITGQGLGKRHSESIIFHSQLFEKLEGKTITLLMYWKHIMKIYIWWQNQWHVTVYGASLCHKRWQLW